MFIGHWAPALALAARPKAPGLGTLFVAGQLVDWAFFGLLLTGTEAMRFRPGVSVMNPMDLYHMPYTHSLLGSAVFAAAFGALVLGLTKSRAAAGIAALVLLSHWFLDLLVHVPDLTLAGSPPKLGLALWNYPTIEMPLELGLTFGALWLYVRRKRPAPLRVGVLAAVLLALQAVNWFGPVEPHVTTGTSLLAFFAYGAATLAAWWMGKSAANSARTG
ncbi:hypothetical protein [Novosphingobium arvoryzae]|uniref:Metal-dependent hydrolase n=1 Tax=Novosphingobium arvoryzae TaxID=1256514 RepID=A0A918REW9_9SPHN|nr:hypothetical protein [Novosphingobium arvoryzae]GGZ94855.1 hypothetical protein GCM10011617_13410 [Novosphingobium arvoryzae]